MGVISIIRSRELSRCQKPSFECVSVYMQDYKKMDNFYSQACVLGPLLEECVFRGLIQTALLTHLPKIIVKKIAPNKEKNLDSTIAKIVRVVLAASLFSAVHILNKGTLPDSYVMAQVVSSFAGGVVFGTLKESRVGLLGAIGAHMLNNCVASVLTSLHC